MKHFAQRSVLHSIKTDWSISPTHIASRPYQKVVHTFRVSEHTYEWAKKVCTVIFRTPKLTCVYPTEYKKSAFKLVHLNSVILVKR
jgi:hypothetical protein